MNLAHAAATSLRAAGTSIDLLMRRHVGLLSRDIGVCSVRDYPPDSVGNPRRRPRPPAARSILGAERKEAA